MPRRPVALGSNERWNHFCVTEEVLERQRLHAFALPALLTPPPASPRRSARTGWCAPSRSATACPAASACASGIGSPNTTDARLREGFAASKARTALRRRLRYDRFTSLNVVGSCSFGRCVRATTGSSGSGGDRPGRNAITDVPACAWARQCAARPHRCDGGLGRRGRSLARRIFCATGGAQRRGRADGTQTIEEWGYQETPVFVTATSYVGSVYARCDARPTAREPRHRPRET